MRKITKTIITIALSLGVFAGIGLAVVAAQGRVTEDLCRREHSAPSGSFVSVPVDDNGDGIADLCVLPGYFPNPNEAAALMRLREDHPREFTCHMAAVEAGRPSNCGNAAPTPEPTKVITPPPPSISTPSPVTNPVGRLRLSDLRVEPERSSGYNRNLFSDWIDADRDGCNTRMEVLIAESVYVPRIEKRFCGVSGTWFSPYDGETYAGGSPAFDIDHMVPLKEAWDSGAWAWTESRRDAFANDLGYEDSLVAVSASSNRSKGARDIAEWLPPNTEVRCWYASAWVAVKIRWGLSVDQAEMNALVRLEESCGSLSTNTKFEPATEFEISSPVEKEEPVEDLSGCHPAYDPCIPHYDGDALNCGDIPRNKRPVTVKQIGVDPYRLDRDRNGLGCTS